MKDKKAQIGHGMTWLWKFLMLILIIGGVVAVVASHYSRNYDVRYYESSVLSRKLVECIAPNGILKSAISPDTIRECFPVSDNEMFVNISVDEKPTAEIGKTALQELCKAKEQGTQVKYYPGCLESTYTLLKSDKKLEFSKVKITIVISKVEKNL